MPRPSLVGDAFLLRPACAADRDALARLLREPSVRRYLCDDRVLPDATVERILADSEALAAQGLGLWAIATDADPFAGIVDIKRIDAELAAGTPAAGLFEPAVAVSPALAGRGLGARALGVAMAHARDGAGLTALGALCDEPNVASRRMLARCGFVEVGRAHGAVHPLIVWRAELRPPS